MRKLRQFFDRENYARLIVGPHRGEDRSVIAERCAHFLDIDRTIFAHASKRHFVTPLLVGARDPQDRAVFDCRRYNMPALRKHLQRGMESGVVRFRAATGEKNFPGITSQQRRHLGARVFDRLPYPCGARVTAGRIRVFVSQKWQHRVDHRRIGLRRRVIV